MLSSFVARVQEKPTQQINSIVVKARNISLQLLLLFFFISVCLVMLIKPLIDAKLILEPKKPGKNATSELVDSRTDEQIAYYGVCNNKMKKYGNPTVFNRSSGSYSSGLTYANLVDLNADGSEELIVAWQTWDSLEDDQGNILLANPQRGKSGIEVWTYRDNKLEKIFGCNEVSEDYPDLDCPFIEFFEMVDGKGYALSISRYDSEYPEISLSQKIYSFTDNKSSLLSERSQVRQEVSDSSFEFNYQYYSGHYETEIDRTQYEEQFYPFIINSNRPAIRANFYSFGFQSEESFENKPERPNITLTAEETNALTLETLEKISPPTYSSE